MSFTRLPPLGARPPQVAMTTNHLLKNTRSLKRLADRLSVSDSIDLDAGKVYEIGGVQVVGPRATGWAADTGTADTTAHATYAAGADLAFSDPPTAVEMSALVTRLHAIEAAFQIATQEIKALKDLVLLHGLAGA